MAAALAGATPAARATTYTAITSGALTAPTTYSATPGATAIPVNGDTVVDNSTYVLTYGAADYKNGQGLTSLGALTLATASKSGTFTQTAGNLSIGTFSLGSTSGSTSSSVFLMQGGVSNITTLTIGTGLAAGVNETGGTINLAGGLSFGSLGNGTQSVAVNGATFNVSGASIVLGSRANTNTFPNATLVVSGGGLFNSLNAASVVSLGNAGGTPTGAVGVLNVSSGTFNDNGATAAVNIGSAAAGVGTVLVGPSGAFNQTAGGASMSLALAANATGTLNVSGGTVTYGGANLFVANAGAANASGSVLVSGGGTISAPATTLVLGQFGGANAAAGPITTGSLTMGDTSSVTVARLLLGGANATTYVNGIVNLNGGTLSTGGINLGATSATPGASTLAFNANGGTVVATFNASTNATFFSGLQVNLLAGGLTFNTGGNTVAFASGMAGAGAFTKVGAGKLAMTASSTYAGGTTVSAGTLAANGAAASLGSGTTAINGGVLAGTGATGGPVVINAGGTITAGTGPTPSDTPGTLATGAQTWNGGGAYAVKISGDGSTADQLVMSGLTVAATLGTPFTVAVTGVGTSPSPVTGTGLVLAVDNSGSAEANGVFQNAINAMSLVLTTTNLTTTSGSAPQLTEFDTGTSQELVLADLASAPEPTSLLLAGLGAAPLVLGRRRRTRPRL